ncbi:LysR family transcriptional regulator [Polynucleobacter wuianus]|uniref:LysR family transcriptional regulator n=1 Tax=Polynucleobacter wuianus TaxID=1743168 RepID=UPI001C0ADBBF|nr:LysR family transcriptional regulator [Polynucleobacter wuianus]MBU3611157.1 LysR family transcriptional regulator [Polynucleobacter wuianus]
MKVTLKQLKAFALVAENNSFVEAANRMHLTSAALSSLIKQLEESLNIRLFDRTTRKSQLTAAGKDFYPLAIKVLEDLKHAVESIRDVGLKKSGVVRVACTPLYSSTTLPRLIAKYKSTHPSANIYILDSLNEQVLKRVTSGEADFGIAPERQLGTDLKQISLLKDQIYFICKKNHAFARLKHVSWKKVLEEPIISLTDDFTRQLQLDLSHHSSDLVLRPIQKVSLITTALGMVNWGLGVTVQPQSVLPLLKSFQLIALPIKDPIISRRLSLIWDNSRELSPAAKSLYEFLILEIKNFKYLN